jgi:hypothetical protein
MDLKSTVGWTFPSLALMLPGHLIAVVDDDRHRVMLISKIRRDDLAVRAHRPARHAARLSEDPDGMDHLALCVPRRHRGIVGLVQAHTPGCCSLTGRVDRDTGRPHYPIETLASSRSPL